MKQIAFFAALMLLALPAWCDYQSDFKARYDAALTRYAGAKQMADEAYKECISAQQV